MNIQVNGETRTTEKASLAELLDDMGYQGAAMATAVNGDFVAADERHHVTLSDGDEIDVLIPMQGG